MPLCHLGLLHTNCTLKRSQKGFVTLFRHPIHFLCTRVTVLIPFQYRSRTTCWIPPLHRYFLSIKALDNVAFSSEMLWTHQFDLWACASSYRPRRAHWYRQLFLSLRASICSINRFISSLSSPLSIGDKNRFSNGPNLLISLSSLSSPRARGRRKTWQVGPLVSDLISDQ